jgi:hypothetical protein
MTTEHKITYVANIYDERDYDENESSSETSGKQVTKRITRRKKKETHLPRRRRDRKEKINARQKLFCKCGGSVEFLITPISRPIKVEEYDSRFSWRIDKLTDEEIKRTGIYGYEKSDLEFEPVICPACGCSYSNYNQVEVLTPHNSNGQNISRVRTFVFENEKTLALCCFGTKLIVNQKSKKLLSREVKNFITFNKKNNFFIRGGQARRGVFLRKFGLRFIANNVRESIWGLTSIQTDRVSRGLANQEKADSDMLSGIEEFCHRLLFLINPKDAEKLNSMLADTFGKELAEMYDDLHDTNTHPKPDELFALRHNFLFRYRIPAIMSVIIYPPIATLFFTKGIDFTLGLLNTWIVPSLCILKKEYPTSPVKIMESMVRLKMIEDSRNRRSMNKADKKAQVLSEKEGKQVYPKRYYKYDSNIPDDIKKGDERVESVKITKSIFRNMVEPELTDSILFASLNRELLPKNYMSLTEKYGLESCSILFRQVSIAGRERIEATDLEHVIRLVKKFIDKNRIGRKYKHYFHTVYSSTQSPPVDMYSDTIRIMNLLNRDKSELIATKDFDEVKVLHDRLVQEYALVKNELIESAVKKSMSTYKHMDAEIDGVSFTVLDSVSELNNESSEMHHCVRTYAQSVAEGSSVIFRIKDSSDGSRATLGTYVVKKKDDTFEHTFSQLKALHNAQATTKIRKAVFKFLKTNKIVIDEFHLGHDMEGANKNDISDGFFKFGEDYGEQVKFV